MAKIDILMASYNGAHYISAQICSILSQSYTDWRLLIHDDGSSDSTIEILRYWAKLDSRIIFLEDGVICGGAAANFMHLLTFADADFVMFADQDDIWLDNKIRTMFNIIIERNNNNPQLVYGSLYVWYPDEGVKGIPVRSYPKDLCHFLFLNTAMHGCVAIFNRSLLDLMKRWKGPTIMHDQSLQLLAVSLGEIVYMDLPLMLYRRHSNSITGDTVTRLNGIRRIMASDNIPVLFSSYYDTVKYFNESYADLIPERDKKILQEFLQMPHKNLYGKLKTVIIMNFKLYNSTIRLLCKIILRKYMSL